MATTQNNNMHTCKQVFAETISPDEKEILTLIETLNFVWLILIS